MAQTKGEFCHLMLHVFRAKPLNVLPRRQHLRSGDILYRSIYEELRGAAESAGDGFTGKGSNLF